MVIKILNLDKCIKKFKNISEVDLSQPIKEMTHLVRDTAKDEAPFDVGILSGSITAEPEKLGRYHFGGKVFTTTEYAIYQEFGTSKPHFVPAKIGGKETGIKGWAIRHNIKAALNPKWGGMMVSGKPQPFMSKSMNMWGTYIERYIERYLKQYLRLKSS